MTRTVLIIVLCFSLYGCATMKRHPVVFGLAAGAVAGGIYGRVSRLDCQHYENGQNGVNTHCPVYPPPAKW